LLQQSERIRETKRKIKQQQRIQDKIYSEEYLKMLEKQEEVKMKKVNEIKSIIDHQPTSLPSERVKNIYGHSVQEEELHMLNKMKEQEAQDKANKYLSRMQKLEKQTELRNYLDQQLKEKQERKSIEKIKNSYYHSLVEQDKKQFSETQKSMQTKK
jgi:hypothetical protein